MKSWFSSPVSKWIVIPVLALFFLASCSKDDSPPAFQGQSKTYTLLNYSTGSAVEAGSFTVYELENGTARASLNLNTGYRVAGTKFKATITVADAQGVELVYSDLGEVDGAAGTLEVNPVISSGTSTPIQYKDIISKTGYTVKVTNGSNVQAKGTIM